MLMSSIFGESFLNDFIEPFETSNNSSTFMNTDVEENEIIINSELLNNDFDDLAFEPEIIKGDEDKESAIKYDY